MSINPAASNYDRILPILYDLALTIGSDLSMKTLLRHTLQRFLYHTSFPAGFICRAHAPITQETSGAVGVVITAAIGDFRLNKAVGSPASLPAALFASEPAIRENVPELLSAIPGKQGHYNCFLKLIIPDYGYMILLGSVLPENSYIMTTIFNTALAQLGRAILLCSANDAQKELLISEKLEAEEQVQFLAHYDPLTKLPNLDLIKKTATEIIPKAFAGSFQVYLVSINVDSFNLINNSLGHYAGDALLIKISQRLANCARGLGFVSRIDADNFLTLINGLHNIEGIISFVQNIIHDLSQPFDIDNKTVNITSTIGIGSLADDGDDFDALFQRADTALKFAKGNERGSYKFFDESMYKTLQDRFALENHLRPALEKNELSLHFQPYVDFRTKRVCGAEALLRWENPALGSVPPLAFIPVAEQTGLILPIGEWVIMEACRQCALWRSAGFIKTVAVNVSAIQFKRADVKGLVSKYLEQFNLPPDALEIELTESIMIDGAEQSLQIVADLKKMGITLSLDDFGTGYSSFSYLSRFPIDKLKIDKSFVDNIALNAEAAKIAAAIVNLGKSLGLKTTAEGVETIEQSRLLESFGCDFAQGYLYSKPLPPDELAGLIDGDGGLKI
jgi:diguanylate cyclase (GGDEF)-like protein